MTQDPELYRLIGKRLRTRRRSLELSQTQVARACDTSFQQIQRHEAGEHQMTVARMLQLAEVLQVPISYFLEPAVEDAYPAFAEQRQSDGAGR